MEDVMSRHRERLDGSVAQSDGGEAGMESSDFLASRPGPPEYGNVEGSSDYHTARDEQQSDDVGSNADSLAEQGSADGGPIDESQVDGGVPAELPGQLIARRHSIGMSDESNMVAPWMPKRSNRVFGQYFKTFGERKRATGGGIGGFFKALFGKGMKRANVIAGANARRAEERGADERRTGEPPLIGEAAGLRSALRARLANEGQATDVGANNFPREPGIDYDPDAVLQAREAFQESRDRLGRIRKPSQWDARITMGAHAEYDLSTGTRSQALDADMMGKTDDKFNAIVGANEQWGANAAAEDSNPHVPKPRLRNQAGVEKKVRFKDGLNDQVGQPVNKRDDNTTKVRPTGVRFHPIPMTDASRGALSKKEQKRLGVSDEEALANERALWPMRNNLSRMDDGRLEVTGMNAGYRAQTMAEANPAPDSAEDHTLREGAFTEQIASEIVDKRDRDRHMRAQTGQQAFPVRALGQFNKFRVLQQFGHLDQGTDLSQQMSHVPRTFFRDTYWNSYEQQVQSNDGQQQPMAPGPIEEEQ